MIGLKKYRVGAFPNIKDFSKPQNNLRNKHPKDMNMAEFLWFSPGAYKIIKVSTPLIFGIVSIILSKYVFEPLSFQIIFIIISIGLFLISIKSYLNIKNTDINMFDVFIRDYDYKIGGKI